MKRVIRYALLASPSIFRPSQFVSSFRKLESVDSSDRFSLFRWRTRRRCRGLRRSATLMESVASDEETRWGDQRAKSPWKTKRQKTKKEKSERRRKTRNRKTKRWKRVLGEGGGGSNRTAEEMEGRRKTTCTIERAGRVPVRASGDR